MKKIVAFTLALVLALCLTACGGGGNKQAIIGAWHITDEASATTYGIGIEFTKDGKLRYGLTEDTLASLSDMSEKEAAESLAALDSLFTMEYKIKSDTEMDVTMKALFGLAKETTTVSYSLNGDTLEFDGATYSRVK